MGAATGTKTPRVSRRASAVRRTSGAFAPLLSLLSAFVAPVACSERTLTPLGEALVVVDTDLPVPRVASRLRIDTYAASGDWLETFDVARPDPRDWPVSFSVAAADDVHERDVYVRLRVYGGRARDTRPEDPRLVKDGVDITPDKTPVAALTVDRVVRLHLVPGVRGRAVVVAEAACAGSGATIPRPSADGSALPEGAFASCIDREGIVSPSTRTTLEPSLDRQIASRVGTAARTACPPGGPAAEAEAATPRICIEGGAFVFGSDDDSSVPDAKFTPRPMRVVRVRTFRIDRDEVTVGVYRAALASGFVPPVPAGVTEGPLGNTFDTSCTYSAAPRDREAFPMNCVSWETSRAYCNNIGGDLPTEAEWEYAATSSDRTGKADFPWGDALPSCGRAVYGRLALAGSAGACEASAGTGPTPFFAIRGTATVVAAPGDVSIDGVYGFGGSVAEWARDAAAAFDDPCFTRTSLDPFCDASARTDHPIRGGSWASPPIFTRSTTRSASNGPSSITGFRCRYDAR